MKNILAERIKNVKLTKKQKVIADYFIKNQEKLGSLSSKEVAQEIGVSDASVIRFSREIGFDGYADLRTHIYDMLVENAFSDLSLSERVLQNREKYQDQYSPAQYELLVQQNINALFQSNKEEDFETIAELLSAKGKRKYVIGLRGCRGIAVSFGRLLTFMVPQVITILDGECASLSSLQDADAEDVLIMFVFSRFYKIDLTYLKLAREKGMKICLVVNDAAGPLNEYADIIILVNTYGMSFFNTTIAASMAAEYILTCVGTKTEYQNRLEQRDELTEEQRLNN